MSTVEFSEERGFELRRRDKHVIGREHGCRFGQAQLRIEFALTPGTAPHVVPKVKVLATPSQFRYPALIRFTHQTEHLITSFAS
jgi:hypothetical protein